jgi:hypothetical protein
VQPEGIHAPPLSGFGCRWGAALLLALALALAPLWASSEERFLLLQLDSGQSLGFRLLNHPPDAHLLEAEKPLEPRSALETAKLVTRYLSEGRVEDAAQLSNYPKARYERMRESFEGWSEEDFRNTYGRYFASENRIVAEVAIGDHRLLLWHLKEIDHMAAFYLVNIEGRLLMDDVPNPTRTNLRRVLEAYRSGKISETVGQNSAE